MNKKTTKIPINQLLCNNQGRQYFFKNGKDLSYTINLAEVEKQQIYKDDNIYTSIDIDTEYTQPLCSNPKNITLELLKSNPNRQLVQFDTIDAITKQHGLEGINNLSKVKNVFVEKGLLEKLKPVKTFRTLHLTTQIKHSLYDDAEILLNPRIKDFYEQNIEDPQFLYPYYDATGCHFMDYLKLKGFKDIEITRFEDSNDIVQLKKLKTLSVKMFGFFMIADLAKTFEGEFLNDIKQALLNKKITLKRRLTAGDRLKAWYSNWQVCFKGLKYRVALEFVDLSGIHGAVSYEEVLTNLDMNTEDKNLLNEDKANMLLPMIERSADFKKYALGDLKNYEVYKKHNETLRGVYKKADIEDYAIDSKLTTGAYTSDIQDSVLLKKIKYTPEEIQELVEDYNKHHGTKKTKLTKKEILSELCLTSSPKHFKTYFVVNRSENDSFYVTHVGSKTPGGRCNANRVLTTSIMSSDMSICDIDIAGAYSTVYNSLDYYFGHPVSRTFTRYKVTLREFLKSKELGKRNYKLVVETKKLLTIEQDLFYSWTNLRITRDKIKTTSIEGLYRNLLNPDFKNDEFQYPQSVDLNSTNSNIFSTELHNTTLTWDDIDCILSELTPEQREEMLDKIYMKLAIYYPESMRCETIEEYKAKIKNFKNLKKYDAGDFNEKIADSKIDNRFSHKSHFWVGINYGELIGEIIKIARAQCKESNPSLSRLFKTVGNTLYGINVSQYFITSNLVLAANITSMCRIGMWYFEKALFIHQTITDGGIFDLNKVTHLIYKKIDTTILARAYQLSNRELSRNYKWNTKPITCSGNKITFESDKGWMLDGDFYAISEYKKLYRKINQITMEHVQKIFCKNSLLNDMYKHVSVNSQGEPVYTTKKGLFDFEVKALTYEASFHAAANYYYFDFIEDKMKLKMRGYETKKTVVAYSLDQENNLIADTEYYKDASVVEKFLKNLRDNPEEVEILPPFIKPSILKPNQYISQYNKTYKYSKLLPGDEIYEIVTAPIFTLRYRFKGLKQKEYWSSFITKLKNHFGGLSMEIFYMNENGTCNFANMIAEVDKHISNGVIDPRIIYDPHRNLLRDYKNKYVLSRKELMRQLKNRLRILNVGISQYCYESKDIKVINTFENLIEETSFTEAITISDDIIINTRH